MIAIGLDDADKAAIVAQYVASRAIRKTYVLSPARFAPSFANVRMLDPQADGDGRAGVFIDWPDIQRYVFFYKLMQSVDKDTLVVVNECLRTQNRHDLTYNCIRNYLNLTPHVLVFQSLPIIDTWDDFGVLFDFATGSRRKRERVTAAHLREVEVRLAALAPAFAEVPVYVDAKTRAAYDRDKAKLLAEVRNDPSKDPHNIPRNLYLLGGKAKAARVDDAHSYLARNDRLKRGNVHTYREERYDAGPYRVLEFPHNVGDFADVVTLMRQTSFDVLVADLKVDRWYLDRYQAWAGRVRGAHDMLAEGGATAC